MSSVGIGKMCYKSIIIISELVYEQYGLLLLMQVTKISIKKSKNKTHNRLT